MVAFAFDWHKLVLYCSRVSRPRWNSHKYISVHKSTSVYFRDSESKIYIFENIIRMSPACQLIETLASPRNTFIAIWLVQLSATRRVHEMAANIAALITAVSGMAYSKFSLRGSTMVGLMCVPNEVISHAKQRLPMEPFKLMTALIQMTVPEMRIYAAGSELFALSCKILIIALILVNVGQQGLATFTGPTR